MDYQPDSYQQHSENDPSTPDYSEFRQEPSNYEDRHSSEFATASIVMGIIAIATFCCIYSAIICGALAIIFALLSKGGEMTMDHRGRTGLILGIIGLVVTIVVYAVVLINTISDYGSIQNFLDYYRQFSEQYMSYYQ